MKGEEGILLCTIIQTFSERKSVAMQKSTNTKVYMSIEKGYVRTSVYVAECITTYVNVICA